MMQSLNAYLVTVPGLGLFRVDSTDRAAALAAVASDVWYASGQTTALDTSRCTVQTALVLGDGVELYR